MPGPDDGTPQVTVVHHWIMTVQSERGRMATSDGNILINPATRTQDDVYTEVLNAMKDYVGSTNCTVLFYSLAPNEISALPRPEATR